jgi:Leucine-rich repeat (LRR) protein
MSSLGNNTTDVTHREGEPIPRKRRWPQYSLRVLLLAMTVAAIWLEIWTDRARRQQRAVEMIRERGGSVRYHPADAKVPGLGWLRNRLGVDYFDRVDIVWLEGDRVADADLEALQGVYGVEMLVLLCPKVTDAGLAHLKGLRNLKELRIGGPRITDRGLMHLQHLPRLTSLTLECCAISDEDAESRTPPRPNAVTGPRSRRGSAARVLDAINSPTRMEFIGAPLKDCCEFIQDYHTIEVRIAANVLKEAKAHEGFPVTCDVQHVSLGAGLDRVLEPMGLDWIVAKDVLTITMRGHRDTRTVHVTGAGLEYLKGLSQLRVLDVRIPQFTGVGLEHLKAFDQLEELHLDDTQVTDADLVHLAGLGRLRELSLRSTPISDAGVKHLAKLSCLRYLSLCNTRVADAGVRHLAGLTSLQNLDLGNTGITDVGLSHLKGLTNLRDLWLNSTKITDAGLEHIQGLTRLEKVMLHNTRVTNAGVERLMGLPQLRILVPPRGGVKELQVK